jgi:hypothetical protein
MFFLEHLFWKKNFLNYSCFGKYVYFKSSSFWRRSYFLENMFLDVNLSFHLGIVFSHGDDGVL